MILRNLPGANKAMRSDDLLDIEKENEIEIAAVASEAASTIIPRSSNNSRGRRMTSYATCLFPRVTQV